MVQRHELDAAQQRHALDVLGARRPRRALGEVRAQQPRDPHRLPRRERAIRAAALLGAADGIVNRRQLREVGVSRADVRSEVAAGRWRVLGVQSVALHTGPLSDRARLWQAVWDTGSTAVLDGVSALHAAGLTGFSSDRIDVAVLAGRRVNSVAGVRVHRRRDLGQVIMAGLPRARPEAAAMRAAQWAASDRQAVLLLCLVVQQRLVSHSRLLPALGVLTRVARRDLLHAVVRDICAGAHSLGELDFAAMCRARGLPEPTRQAVRRGPGGRVYLDVAWEDVGLVVEIDGGHHALALNPVDDALRQNEVVIAGERVLRIPVIGLRLAPERFLGQVARAHAALRGRTR